MWTQHKHHECVKKKNSNVVRVAAEMLHWSKEDLSSAPKADGTFSSILSSKDT